MKYRLIGRVSKTAKEIKIALLQGNVAPQVKR